MKKKLITLLLATSMIVTSLAGCGNADVKTSESTPVSGTEVSTGTEADVEISNFNAEGYPIVNEEITLDVLVQIQDSSSLSDPKDMPALIRLEELTGIHAEYEFVKAADWSTKLNLRLATGDYPDVIISIRGTVDDEEYGVTQKVLLPLDDLVDQYMPNYKALLDAQETDQVSYMAASDGQIYTLPFKWGAEYKAASVFFINQSWLDALKLETPTTVEGLTDVLRAFKTGDPNGNGQADEIPLLGTLKDKSLKYMLGMFGVPFSSDSTLYIDDNLKVQTIVRQEGFRKCMEWLHMCYEEGLLDAEAISQDSNTVAAKLSEANAGFFAEYRLTAMGFDAIAEDAVLWIPDENASVYKYNNIAAQCVFVSTTNENVPATMRWLDAWLEKETMASMYYGEKDIENGGWFYDENGLIAQNPNNAVSSDGATHNYLGNNAFVFTPWNYFRENFALGSHVIEKSAYDDIYSEEGIFQKYSNDLLNTVAFNNEQTEQVNLLKTDIKTTFSEWLATFVTEGVTDAKWEEFQKLITDVKMDEFIELYQTGLDALNIK